MERDKLFRLWDLSEGHTIQVQSPAAINLAELVRQTDRGNLEGNWEVFSETKVGDITILKKYTPDKQVISIMLKNGEITEAQYELKTGMRILGEGYLEEERAPQDRTKDYVSRVTMVVQGQNGTPTTWGSAILAGEFRQAFERLNPPAQDEEGENPPAREEEDENPPEPEGTQNTQLGQLTQRVETVSQDTNQRFGQLDGRITGIEDQLRDIRAAIGSLTPQQPTPAGQPTGAPPAPAENPPAPNNQLDEIPEPIRLRFDAIDRQLEELRRMFAGQAGGTGTDQNATPQPEAPPQPDGAQPAETPPQPEDDQLTQLNENLMLLLEQYESLKRQNEELRIQNETIISKNQELIEQIRLRDEEIERLNQELQNRQAEEEERIGRAIALTIKEMEKQRNAENRPENTGGGIPESGALSEEPKKDRVGDAIVLASATVALGVRGLRKGAELVGKGASAAVRKMEESNMRDSKGGGTVFEVRNRTEKEKEALASSERGKNIGSRGGTIFEMGNWTKGDFERYDEDRRRQSQIDENRARQDEQIRQDIDRAQKGLGSVIQKGRARAAVIGAGIAQRFKKGDTPVPPIESGTAQLPAASAFAPTNGTRPQSSEWDGTAWAGTTRDQEKEPDVSALESGAVETPTVPVLSASSETPSIEDSSLAEAPLSSAPRPAGNSGQDMGEAEEVAGKLTPSQTALALEIPAVFPQSPLYSEISLNGAGSNGNGLRTIGAQPLHLEREFWPELTEASHLPFDPAELNGAEKRIRAIMPRSIEIQKGRRAALDAQENMSNALTDSNNPPGDLLARLLDRPPSEVGDIIRPGRGEVLLEPLVTQNIFEYVPQQLRHIMTPYIKRQIKELLRNNPDQVEERLKTHFRNKNKRQKIFTDEELDHLLSQINLR